MVGVAVMVPSLTDGQLAPVLVADPAMAVPGATEAVALPVQPLASLIVTVCDAAETPVNTLETW